MIQKCLSYHEADRPTCEELLLHPWVAGDSVPPVKDLLIGFGRGKPVPVSHSVPKNLAIGGVNPHELRQALLIDSNNSGDGSMVSGSPMEMDGILLESTSTSSLITPPVLSMPEDPNSIPQMMVSNTNQTAPIRRAMQQEFDNARLSPDSGLLTDLDHQHSPLLTTSLGSAYSSAYSSVCTSYVSDSSLCSTSF